MDKENDDRGDQDEREKTPSLVDRLKKLYEDRPIPFALGIMAISALAMIVGGLMLEDGSVIAPSPYIVPGPYFQGG